MGTLVLLKKCQDFEQKASVIITDDTEPFLQQLSKLDYNDAREFCDKHCIKKLGEGSSRAAYQLSNEFLIKISINERGDSQNAVEMQLANQRSCVNAPIVADGGHKWILFHMTEKLTKSDFEKLTGFTFAEFTDSLFYKFNQEKDFSKPRRYNEVVNSELFTCVAGCIYDLDLLIGDLAKISSWGLKDEKPVLVDTGLNREVFDLWYDRNSTRSPKSSS